MYINYPIHLQFNNNLYKGKVLMSFGNSGKVKVSLENQVDQQYSNQIKDCPV